ncbi:MAG: hypothetical protein ABSE42_15930 [Bryobacteraceae bacterium]
MLKGVLPVNNHPSLGEQRYSRSRYRNVLEDFEFHKEMGALTL